MSRVEEFTSSSSLPPSLPPSLLPSGYGHPRRCLWRGLGRGLASRNRLFGRKLTTSSLPPTLPPSLLQGMVILDAAFGEAWAAALRAEIVFLVERGEMQPNHTRFVPQEVGREGGRDAASAHVSLSYIHG